MSRSNMVEVMMKGSKRIFFFVSSNCHFIFMLFVEENIVSTVSYVSHI